MQVEGNWWILVDEEPFNEAVTPQIAIAGDRARLGERAGAWSRVGDRIEIAFPAAPGANPQRYAFGLKSNPNFLSGTLYEAFGTFPEEFRLGEQELPDHIWAYPALLSRVEPVSADILYLETTIG